VGIAVGSGEPNAAYFYYVKSEKIALPYLMSRFYKDFELFSPPKKFNKRIQACIALMKSDLNSFNETLQHLCRHNLLTVRAFVTVLMNDVLGYLASKANCYIILLLLSITTTLYIIQKLQPEMRHVKCCHWCCQMRRWRNSQKYGTFGKSTRLNRPKLKQSAKIPFLYSLGSKQSPCE